MAMDADDNRRLGHKRVPVELARAQGRTNLPYNDEL